LPQPICWPGPDATEAKGSVTIGALTPGKKVGDGRRRYAVPVTVTNQASQESLYWIALVLWSPDKKTRLGTAYPCFPFVSPGEMAHQKAVFRGCCGVGGLPGLPAKLPTRVKVTLKSTLRAPPRF
jgi:hypothetical protein